MTKKELYRQMDEIVGKDNVREYPKGFSAKCTVSTYEQFEEIIELCNEYYKELGLNVCYRGQNNSSWKLEPSISRNKSLCKKEKDVLYSYLNKMHLTDFTVDTIFKAQHYGESTRLLDVSLNYDVALWFACQKNNKKNGTVFAIPVVRDENLSARFVEYNLWQIKNMELLLKCSCQNQIFELYKQQSKDLVSSFDFLGLANIYHSNLNDTRIINQSACGILCEFKLIRQNNRIIQTYQKQFTFCVIKIDIKSQFKASILKSLENKGIDKKFLFGNDK